MSRTRLSPLDEAFLAVESPTAHMHVGWAAVFDPPPGPAPRFDQLRAHIAARLPRAPRYRQQLQAVPFGWGSPVWVDDPDFEITNHVVEDGAATLSEVVDECMSEPLPKKRPLWQIRVATRIEDGRVGIVGKAHHCMVDGLAAVELASLLLDPSPDAAHPRPERWRPEPGPHPMQALAGGVGDLLRREFSLVGTPIRAARSPQRALRLAGRIPSTLRALGDAVRPARYVPDLNAPISPRRHLGLLARPLEELQAIKRAFGVKLNDVVLAVSAAGVRRFLQRRGGSPCALKTMVPVSMRPADDADALGNRISFMFVDLPCDEPDPVRRLHAVHLATSKRKQAGEPEGAEAVIGSLGLAPPQIQRAVSKLVASPRAFNLVVSNIPGPEAPMYMRGCRLREAYPVVPLADRHALSIGVTTIGDGAFFGLYADRESLPDVDLLAAEIDAEIDQLAALSGVGAPIADAVTVPAS